MRWWEELQEPLLGRYRVEKLLGQGGMAEVLLARDERFEGKRVAIKAPTLDSFAPNQLAELLLRFQREVQRQGSESIAGVVPIIDAGEVTDSSGKSQPFLVMDYLSGGSLGDALGGSSGRRERTQTLAEVLEWLRPVATTLDRLHTRKYLHRDVKPDNILFNADGDPFLSDFGISTSLDDVAGAATMMSVLGAAGPGSPGYQSPESLRGDKLAASDQFSLAVTAYEALAGRLPMVANTRDAWIGALANWKPTPISELCPDLPAPAAAVLMRAISVEPRERYLSCSAFAQALAEAVTAPTRAPADVAPVMAAVAAPAAAPAQAAAEPKRRADEKGVRGKLQSIAVYGAIVLVALTAGAIMLGRWLDDGDSVFATVQDNQAAAAASAPAGPASSHTAVAPTPGGPVIHSDAITASEGVIAPDGSVAGDMSTLTLEKAAIAMAAIDREATFARDVAENDSKNMPEDPDNSAHRKAIASSLAAAEKSRDAALVAANVAEFVASFAEVSHGRGGSLLPYALDIAQRAEEFAKMPAYVGWSRDKQLPMDPRIDAIARDTTKARERAEKAGEGREVFPLEDAEKAAATTALRNQLGSGQQFETRYVDAQPGADASKPTVEACTTFQHFGGAVDSRTGPLRWQFNTTCSERLFGFGGEFNIVEAKAADHASFRVDVGANACHLADGSPCPGSKVRAPMKLSADVDLVTGKLLLIGLTAEGGGGPPAYYLLSRSTDRPLDGEPAPEAASSP